MGVPIATYNKINLVINSCLLTQEHPHGTETVAREGRL